MITLVVLACLASDPAACAPVVVARAEAPEALSCGAAEPQALAAWQAANPDLVAARHWCMHTRPALATSAAAESPLVAAAADPRLQPLAPCAVTTRAQGRIWQARNPGWPAIQACAEAGLSN